MEPFLIAWVAICRQDMVKIRITDTNMIARAWGHAAIECLVHRPRTVERNPMDGAQKI